MIHKYSRCLQYPDHSAKGKVYRYLFGVQTGREELFHFRRKNLIGNPLLWFDRLSYVPEVF